MFYDNLLKACQMCGVKATPIVKECGGASGSISGWKKGIMPNSDIIVKLSARLNVSCDFLLTGKDTLISTSDYSTDEQELIDAYRKLTSITRNIIKGKISEFIYDTEQDEKFKKTNDEPAQNNSILSDLSCYNNQVKVRK